MNTNRIIILGILPTSTGKVHQQSRIIGGAGVAPTITARDYKDPIRTLVQIKETSNGK